jgi:hypothetical protein
MSVINDFQVNSTFPSTVGGTGTAVKYFPKSLGSSIGVESVAPSASSNAGQLAVPGSNRLNGQWFGVLVGGDILSGVSDSSVTVEVALYAQTAAPGATPSYTKLATTGALPALLEQTHYAFAIRASLFGDTASGVVRGNQYAILGANNVTTASLTNNLSSINFGTEPPFGLVVGVQFNSSDAGNSAVLTQFQITAE